MRPSISGFRKACTALTKHVGDRYGVSVEVASLDQWLADYSACDVGFLRHFYVTGERRPFREFWKPDQPRIVPLPIPAFTPTRWRRREQAIVL